MWQSLHLNYEHYMRILAEAEEHRIWEKIPPDEPYGSESNMLKQVEVGSVKDVHKRMRIQTLAAQARQILREQGKNDGRFGNRRTSEYVVRLIAKENPRFAERVASGEVAFTSARQAARAAGVSVPSRRPTVSLSDNLERVADKLKSYYGPDQVNRIIEWLRQETEESSQPEGK